MRYTIRLIIIVMMLLMKVEKKNTIARSISSLRNVKKSDQTIRWVISISFQKSIPRKSSD